MAGDEPVSSEACMRELTPVSQLGEEALKAAPGFLAYFGAMRERLKERGYLLELTEIALIAEEHLLLMGPPGNAKSMLADEVLGNIVDAKTGHPSYYKIQMTPETTLSETHGPLDYKLLTETNRYGRIYSEGLLHSRNGFIDEIFDGRANSMRNILGLLNERAHAQGPRIQKGDIETVIAATNRYISEVYEKTGDDGPKALLDRFAFSAFVPGDFEEADSAISLITGTKHGKPAVPRLTFQEVESIRAMTAGVEIPGYVAKFLALLRGKIKTEVENIEQSSVKAYREKLKNGEEARPPYRSTKYMSPRTLGKAGGILRAIVVRDWVLKGGKRKLKADLDDLRKLEAFFTLNGPSDAFVEAQLAASTNPHEHSQLTAILQERDIFRRNFDQINAEVNGGVYQYAVTELQSALSSGISDHEKEELGKRMTSLLLEVQGKRIAFNGKLRELDGAAIALDHVNTFLVESLQELLGAQYEPLVNQVVTEAQARKDKAIAQKKAAQEAEERQIKEQERQRILEEAKKRSREDQLRLAAERLRSKYQDLTGFEVVRGSSSERDWDQAFQGGVPGGTSVVSLGSDGVLTTFSLDGPPVAVPLQREAFGQVSSPSGFTVLDGDHVAVFSGSAVWVFNSGTGEAVIDFHLGRAQAPRLNSDGSKLQVFEPEMRRFSEFDWKTGAPTRRRLPTEFVSKIEGVAGGPIGLLLDNFEADCDGFRFSEDGKKAFITISRMSGILEVDFETMQATYVYDQPTKGEFGFVSEPGVQDRVYGIQKDGESLRVLEVELGTYKSRIHELTSPDAFPLHGFAVVEDGKAALIGTETRGLVLIDLVYDGIAADHVLGSPNMAREPRSFGAGRIGYSDARDGQVRYVHLVERK